MHATHFFLIIRAAWPVFGRLLTCAPDNQEARSISLPEAIQHLLPLPFGRDGGTHVNTATDEGRSCQGVVAELVLGDESKGVGAGLKDEGPARFVGCENLVADQDRRGAK